MRIRLERSGGFAGIKLSSSVDTEELSPDEAGQVRKMVEGATFFELPDSIKSARPMPDRFVYRIQIEEGGKTKTVEVDEASVPDPLKPLVRHLVDAARKK
ncbi:MAG: protealysin inhibitor emfourin [Terriglobia bacterium]